MTYDPIIFQQPLEAAKNEIVSKLNIELHIMLSLTDWTIIRREEIGSDLPAGVSEYRNALRQQHQANETLIKAASTIEQLETIANSLDPIYGYRYQHLRYMTTLQCSCLLLLNYGGCNGF